MLKMIALAMALLPLGAQDEMIQRYLGKWAGTATANSASGASDKYKVTAVVSRSGENLKVSYVSRNSVGARKTGNLMASPKGDGACYTANLAANAKAGIPMMADLCLDESGNISITSLMANGRAVMSESGKSGTFEMKSPLGSAKGSFRKMLPKKKKRKAA
ncbi:MAG: hypothetical protein A2049_12775 [Elusimicrobia bacterium GWA2_62_23]|nr:MAG: hypothetical protein A2049_12775 [Elusimicrobia bacterium GWA2_62_23]